MNEPRTEALHQQPHLILGTAGHIDHGKSSLVKMLTGTDPDRLAEEKKRGITIELGFAQMHLPDGNCLGVVDVPGHERFVKHMVAGATGIDLALLVIAADDGIMPQTIEHLAVLELLEVSACVVALTKIDLVDDEWRAFVTQEITSALATTPYASAPIVGVSSRTGEGKEDLLAALAHVAKQATHLKEAGSFRMPIDRVFTVKGFGTVVTGSLWSGCAFEGLELTVASTGASTRIRSVQMHGKSVDLAPAGNRVALSLAGLSTQDVRPGDFLCTPEQAQLSDRFDTNFTYLDPFSFGKPFKSGSRVHVAHGTTEVLGRVLLMNGEKELASGSRAFAQIRLEEPLPLAYRDSVIMRSYSPASVIGGGRVLTAHPRRRTTISSNEESMLQALEQQDLESAVGSYLETTTLPETEQNIVRMTGLEAPAVATTLHSMVDAGTLLHLGKSVPYYARPALVQKLLSQLDRTLLTFHVNNPHETGIAKEALRHLFNEACETACFDALLTEGAERDALVISAGTIAHPQASAGAHKAEQEAADKIFAVLQRAEGNPPELSDIAEKLKINIALARKAAALLVRDGRAERVETNRYYDRAVTERYRSLIKAFIEEQGPATAAQLKEAMGSTRKYAMPLLEHFDSLGFTRREGDLRVLDTERN
jgi:selenocysteine-specific elongation factor